MKNSEILKRQSAVTAIPGVNLTNSKPSGRKSPATTFAKVEASFKN
jgi:hypothetical protein